MNLANPSASFWWMAGASLLTSAAVIRLSAIILAFSQEWRRLLLPHLLSFSVGTLLGGLLAWVCLPYLHAAVPYVMALAAAGFVYVAMADLVPSLHRCARLRQHGLQLALIVAGMVIIGWFQSAGHAH